MPLDRRLLRRWRDAKRQEPPKRHGVVVQAGRMQRDRRGIAGSVGNTGFVSEDWAWPMHSDLRRCAAAGSPSVSDRNVWDQKQER